MCFSTVTLNSREGQAHCIPGRGEKAPEGTRNSPAPLPHAPSKTVRSPTCSPKGTRDPTPFTSCTGDPAGHVPAPGAASSHGISCSLHGCGELQGAAGKARGFQGGGNSHTSPSLKSLLCPNANICLVGLWVLSRTGNGWMSCAKGCRDRGGTHPAPAPHWPPLAPNRARAESLGHPEVTTVSVPLSLLQSFMSLCRETLLLCPAAAPQVFFCSHPGLLSCSESEKVTSGREEK